MAFKLLKLFDSRDRFHLAFTIPLEHAVWSILMSSRGFPVPGALLDLWGDKMRIC